MKTKTRDKNVTTEEQSFSNKNKAPHIRAHGSRLCDLSQLYLNPGGNLKKKIPKIFQLFLESKVAQSTKKKENRLKKRRLSNRQFDL